MAVEVGTAYVTIVPSAKGFAGKMQSELGGGLSSAGTEGGKQFGGGMLGSVKSIAGPLAGIFAVTGAVDFLKGSIAEARESQKVGALTAQVISSTGGAAKVTAGQVGDLANAISAKSGIDDEAIQSASNLLLTFTNVRNEVGAGNDVFNQATQAATDMGVALGGDPKSSAIQLGKALNDPVKGITALTRVGVSFTQQQKDQVAAMVKSGDTLGAQKLILGELNKEFGGAAAAAATGGEKMSTAFANFKETIGTALLPVLDTVEGKLSDFLGYVAANIGPALQAVGDFVAPLVTAFQAFFGALQEGDVTSDGMVGTFEQVGAFLHDTLPPAIALAQAAFAAISGFITTEVVPRVMDIINAIGGFVAVALPIVMSFVSGMMNRIRPMMPQIQAIFTTIGSIITTALDLISAVIGAVTGVILFIWTNWGTQIMNFVAAVWQGILGVVGPALRMIQAVIAIVLDAIHGNWSGVWDGIKALIGATWDFIKGIFTGALGIIQAALSLAWSVIATAASAAWNGILSLLSGAWDAIKGAVISGVGAVVGFVGGLPGRALGALGAIGSTLLDAGSRLIGGLLSGITGAVGGLWSFISGIPGTILSNLGSIGSTLLSAGGDLISGFIRGIQNKAGDIVAAIQSSITDKLPDFVKTALGIGSPSKVFMKLGASVSEGMALGIFSGASGVQRAADAMLPTVGGLGLGGSNTFGAASGSSSLTASRGGAVVNVYPQPGQSEEEIGTIAAHKVMFHMASA